MGLQEKIKKDLTAAMKAKDDEKKSALRVIMGEFGRHTEKSLSDVEVIKIIKKLVKSEKEVLEKSGGAGTSRFLEIAETYLPRMASESELKTWISENINFAEFNNKMQAMRPIMQHFGSDADGNLVKKILMDM